MEGKLWAEESVDLVLESRRQLFGVAPCVSWGTDAAAWLRMEGFAVVACGESFVLPGGQTPRSVDRMVAAAQGAAHGIGYNSSATIVLLVTTTGMFCDKASWSIVSRREGSVLQPGGTGPPAGQSMCSQSLVARLTGRANRGSATPELEEWVRAGGATGRCPLVSRPEGRGLRGRPA